MESLSILELNHNEARAFFLKHESYCSIDLPKYFSFTELLENVANEFSELLRATKTAKHNH